MREKVGEYYVRLDMLSFEQAEEILRLQRTADSHKKFGEIAVDLGYLTEEEIETVIENM